ncbi:MAG TPA: protein kinase [Pyrinomonadaceae bacterium]|jgi:serine/threonine-protein kinase|nr:protein kinase [Pyrinomonadaceae bacterium]
MIGKTISHYRILSQLGEGGMGVVYVAEDTRLGRRVAIKFPHAGRDERHYRARFLREARAVSLLSHKNIAAVFDYGETEDGQPYIVMELVTGQTLGDILAAEGVSVSRAVEVIREVAEALSEAHRRGVVHRDVKPSNVVVNERGEVKVLDFGLAKQLHEEGSEGSAGPAGLSTHTRSDVVIGTPLYLSPEQARGAKVDGRSDLFALGALLYECVAGRSAFSGSNVIEIGAQVLHFDPPPPSRFNSRVPADLDRLTLKALAKKPEDRYQSAAEMAADLARLRARLPADTVRTRRLDTGTDLPRMSALTTVAYRLRRPTVSPLTLGAAVLIALFGVWGYAFLRRPAPHKPPPQAKELYDRGVEALREGAYYRASEALREAVTIDEKYAVARARLAEALMEMDLYGEAQDHLLALRQDEYKDEAPTPEDDLYIKAATATARREYQPAVAAYTELARMNPAPPQVYLDLGRALELNNEPAKAIEKFTDATKRNRSYAPALLRLGTLYARQKNYPAAASTFESAEKLYAAARNREGEAEVHYQRGRMLAGQNKPADARRELDLAYELARESGNVYQQAQTLIQIAYAEQDPARARDYAQRGMSLAQANRMNALSAYGQATLGQLHFLAGEYDAAEEALLKARDSARSNKVRRYEALASLLLGQMRNKQNRQDEAERFLKDARDFYTQGNYRKEANTATIVLSRVQRRRGDYDGALAAFKDQLKVATDSGDMHEVGILRREYGAVYLFRGDFPTALMHFDEALKIFRSHDDKTRAGYTQVVRAAALWQLGRYDEATAALRDLDEIADSINNKELRMNARINQAMMALSRRVLPEARDAAQQARALAEEVGERAIDIKAEADFVLGLSGVLSGDRATGRALCQEAEKLAEKVEDPWVPAMARLTLAEALLESGDPLGAREAALRAAEFFERSGSAQFEWRALTIATAAGIRSGVEGDDARHARVGALLSKMEGDWGQDAVRTYLSRPDLQALQRRAAGGGALASR